MGYQLYKFHRNSCPTYCTYTLTLQELGEGIGEPGPGGVWGGETRVGGGGRQGENKLWERYFPLPRVE